MKLNKKKVAVLGLAGLLALGGAGGALAYIITSASKSSNITADSAIIMNFGSDSSTTFMDVKNLTTTAVQTRTLTVNREKSTSVSTGNVNVAFELTGKNIKVELDTQTWQEATSTNYKTLIVGSTEATASYSYQLPVNSETKSQTYYLRFSVNTASTLAEESENTVTGTLSCTLSYIARAV